MNDWLQLGRDEPCDHEKSELGRQTIEFGEQALFDNRSDLRALPTDYDWQS